MRGLLVEQKQKKDNGWVQTETENYADVNTDRRKYRRPTSEPRAQGGINMDDISR